MKISTESWHFKLMCEVMQYDRDVPFNQPPSSLCKYWWTLVASVLSYPFFKFGKWMNNIHFNIKKPSLGISVSDNRKAMIVRICGVSFCLGIGIYDIIMGDYIFAGIMFFFAVYNALPRGFFGELIKGINKNRPPKPKKYKAPKIKKPKEPNLMWEYLKARKHKVCPLLEFVDPRDEEYK